MPSNDLLRPMGYVKSDRTIRWVNKQADGIYLPSSYGILRISPITDAIIRLSFAKDESSLPAVHPMIAMTRGLKSWKYRESPKLLEMVTASLYLQVEKATGTVYYMSSDKRPLLAERARESRILEKPTIGGSRARLYLDWTKTETLTAMGSGIRATLALKGSARYISHTDKTKKLPMVISDKGYGLVIASLAPTFCCTLPTYGSHICTDGADTLDFYFIAGDTSDEIITNYRKLCGEL